MPFHLALKAAAGRRPLRRFAIASLARRGRCRVDFNEQLNLEIAGLGAHRLVERALRLPVSYGFFAAEDRFFAAGGAIIGTLTAQALKFDETGTTAGIYGFNSALTAGQDTALTREKPASPLHLRGSLQHGDAP